MTTPEGAVQSASRWWDDPADVETHIMDSIMNGDFEMIEMTSDLAPTPTYSLFERVFRKGDALWGVVVGVKYDAIDESFSYLLDTNYQEWVAEDELSDEESLGVEENGNNQPPTMALCELEDFQEF